ncbi:MAG: hypothetical protein AB7W16_13625 [Candidatus Obscuribacterales bacterium]
MEFPTDKMVTAGNQIHDLVCRIPGAPGDADLDPILADFDPRRRTQESKDFARHLEDAGILPALLVAEQSRLDLDGDGVIDVDELNRVFYSDVPTVARMAADFARGHLTDIQEATGGLLIESDFFVPEYAIAYAHSKSPGFCAPVEPLDELDLPRDDLEDFKRHEKFLR